MNLTQIYTNMSYIDLTRYFSGSKQNPAKLEKELKAWYIQSRSKYGYDNSILNVALTIGIRTRKNVNYNIPGTKYLNTILERFKLFNVKNLDDAINQFLVNVNYEIDKQSTIKEAKQYYQAKEVLQRQA